MSSGLVDCYGVPAAPELQRSVQEIDDGLSLRWMTPVGLIPYWAVFFRWPQTDKRWSMVQSGEIPEAEAHDMILQLPRDCPPDQARSLIEKRCRNWGNAGRDDIAKLVERCQEANRKASVAAMQPTLDYADELIDANKHTMLAEFGKTTARVFQSEPTSTKGKKRRKWRPVE